MIKRIAVIRGDGIGPEIVDSAVAVLEVIAEKFGHKFNFTRYLIGGAAIDVFENEPLEADSPFRNLDNVTLVSHMAGTSSDTMKCSADIGYINFTAWFKGEKMPDLRN